MKRSSSVDIEVGARIRLFRSPSKLSQEAIRKQLGLTFQQVQKYEKGTNRISAGRIHQLAKIFGVPIAALFPPDDVSDDKNVTPAQKQMLLEMLSHGDLLLLCRAFIRISKPTVRQRIINLVQELADDVPGGTPGKA